MRAFVTIVPALLVLAGCAATPAETASSQQAMAANEAKVGKALQGYVAGQPQDCVSAYQLRDRRMFGTVAIYNLNGGAPVYRNDYSPGCDTSGFGSATASTTPTGQYCRGDIIRSFDPVSHITTGACTYGAFIPYTRAAR